MQKIVLTGAIALLLSAGSRSASGQSQPAGTTVQQQPAPAARPQVRIKRPKPIRTELSGGLRIATDGWSLYADKGYVRSENDRESEMFHNIRLFQLELSEKKHPKEVKINNQSLNAFSPDRARPFIYGKVNNFYSLKLGYGFRRMIAGKPEAGTVSIHWVGVGGLAAGLLKPYYIDANVPQDHIGTLVRETIKYTDSTQSAFLNERYIVGSAGFAKGLNEISLVPGLHLKTGLHFDFAPQRHTKMAIETGVSAELYTQKVMLMANQEAKPYFFNIYAAIQFGKRW